MDDQFDGLGCQVIANSSYISKNDDKYHCTRKRDGAIYC